MKYTKQQLMQAVASAQNTMKLMAEIFDSITPIVERAVNKIVGTNICGFEIREVQTIVSQVANFITIFFINEEAVRTIRKSDLTKDELDDGMWELIRCYRKGEVTAEEFCNGLAIEQADTLARQIRLTLQPSDIATIYEAEDFDITHEGDQLVLRAGSTELGRLPAEALALPPSSGRI